MILALLVGMSLADINKATKLICSGGQLYNNCILTITDRYTTSRGILGFEFNSECKTIDPNFTWKQNNLHADEWQLIDNGCRAIK